MLAALDRRDVTVVLDNCEHVLDAAADAASRLLGACGDVDVLATSRSPLGLPGESVLPLAPLSATDPAAGRSGPAVELFARCCTDAGVDIGPDDMSLVLDICRRLDGLPLAIEIAAARARYFGVAGVAQQLESGIAGLERPRLRGEPRHRDVAQAIRWSYDLLSPVAATLFRRASVFAGPWSATAAAVVADVDDVDIVLHELIDASLISIAVPTGAETRYRMLQVVRAVASIELGDGAERADTYDRFVDHLVDSTNALLRESGTRWRPGLVADLLEEYDQLAAAIEWSLDHDDDLRRVRRLCAPFWAVVHQGRADDIVVLMRRVLDVDVDRESAGAARAVAVLATAEYVTGHPDRASRLAGELLDDRRQRDGATVTLCRVMGQALNALGRFSDARTVLRRGADVGHELGLTSMALELDVAEALVMVNDPRLLSEAIVRVEQAQERALAVDSPVMASWARAVRCWFGVLAGEPGAADQAAAALIEARSLRYPVAIAVDLRTAAYAHALAGRYLDAVDALTELFDELLGRGALSNLRLLVDATAVVADRLGHEDRDVLAATAVSLPITTMVSAHVDPANLPTTLVAPLPRHHVVGRVRTVLTDLRRHIEADDTGDGGTSRRTATIRRSERSIEFELVGRVASVRPSKGIDDILSLVAAAGRDVSALDLSGAGVEQSSTGEVIDATARRSYERRIRELQEELDEAELHNDFGRTYRIQTELDQIVDHLTAALGTGGRTRQVGGDAERAVCGDAPDPLGDQAAAPVGRADRTPLRQLDPHRFPVQLPTGGTGRVELVDVGSPTPTSRADRSAD
ncbi:MAG: hypothetical protein R2697_01735 [Ilumatobacteraceae bacterium]